MGLGKTYSTKYLVDSNGNTGAANQVLVSTATGVDWVDGSGSGIIGGPYLPLSAGASYPLTGDLYLNNATYIRSTDSNGAVPRMFGINTSNSTYIGPIDAYAGGSIFYGVSANVSAQTFYTGASARMHINSTGNVGIGTTSPGAKLDVNVTGNNTALKLTRDAGVNGVFDIDFDGANTNFNSLYAYTFQTGNTERMRITSGGNVGIGTTSPSQKLHVHGQDVSVYSIFARSDSKWMYLHSGGIDPAIGWDTEGDMRFGTASSNVGVGFAERMRITSTGNVGIGTTSPIQKLQVTGSAYVNNGTLFLDTNQFLRWGNSNQGIKAVNDGNMSFVTGSNERVTINSSGNVGIGTVGPVAKLHIDSVPDNVAAILANQVYARISLGQQGGSGDAHFGASGNGAPEVGFQDYGFYASHNAYRSSTGAWKHSRTSVVPAARFLGSGAAATGNQGFSFDYSANVGTADITWTNLMKILPSGNVGIGTSSPSQTLEVHNTIKIGETGTTSGKLISGDSMVFQIDSDNSSTSSSYRFRANGTADDGTELMRIQENGNVGIGTTSPSTKLDVYGVTTSLGFKTDTTNTNWSLISRDSEGNAPLYVQSANSITGQWIARFNYGSATVNGGDNVLTVAKDSSYFLNTNVGIGMASPGVPLDVSGIIRTSTSFVGNAVIINQVTAATSGGRILFKNNSGSDKMAMEDNGNFGIGTTSPTHKLQVVGNGAFNSTLGVQDPDVSSNGLLQLSHDSTGSSIYSNPASSNGSTVVLRLGINNSEKMRIANNGNVGIGVTNPSARLHVDGTVRFSSSGDRIFIADGSFGTFELGDIDGVSDEAKIVGNGSNIIISNTGTETLTCSGNNRVGIGTTSPQSKLDVSGGDIEVKDIASGVIMKSPNGTRYRVTIANGGTLVVTAV